MNAVIASGVPHLTIALTTLHLIDGQCVIATARAPLQQLVYGCANAGHRGCSEERHEGCAVENGSRCRQAVPAIRELAATLGLSEHAVRDRLGRRLVSLCLPVDTEVHVGRDGRLYVIDLARLMPPTPTPGWYGSGSHPTFLFHHFRPEFLRGFPTPLSSDVLSGFAADDTSRSEGVCLHRPFF